MAEHVGLVLSITGALFLICGYLIWKIWRDKEKGFEDLKTQIEGVETKIMDRVVNLEKEVHGLQLNYLDRFDDVKQTANKHHEELLMLCKSIESKVSEQRTICDMIQKLK